MSLLSNHRAAILAADGVEELELVEPLRALRTQGAEVDVIALFPDQIQGMYLHHKTLILHVDRVFGETVLPEQYDSLVLPGGAMSVTALRNHPGIKRFVRAMDEAEKPIAAISHAAWILISAGVVSGRKMTGNPSLRDDLLNAGASWSDDPLVLDDNLITAQSFKELAAFDSALIELCTRRQAMISPEMRHMVSRMRIS
jgi:protease I